VKLLPELLEPQPAKIGDQIVDLLLDVDNLFKIYLVKYKVVAPIKQIEAHLAKTGASALVLFTKDDQNFELSFVAGGQVVRAKADRAWIERFLSQLLEQKEIKDVLAIEEWVRDVLKDLATQETQRLKRPYTNQGLFSEHYLETRLRETSEWQEDFEPQRRKLLELYEKKKELLKNANEAQTEEEFIQPVLKLLGFSYWVQPKTKGTGGAEFPDYVLYPNEGVKRQAVTQKNDEGKLYAPALAIAEAKYWERDLDVRRRADPRDLAASAVSPAFQIARYLEATGVEWGILTNGREWRLYWGRASDKQKRYFSVDLVQVLNDPEAFRFFWLFFRKEAFLEGAQPSFLRRVLEGSEQYGLRVGKRLKEVVFHRVFPWIAKGFLRYREREGEVPEEALSEAYKATLALLYRVLFLLYAEDRELLPVTDALGYREYSLVRMRREIAEKIDRGQRFSEQSFDYWERLTTLFRIVDKGDSALKVPPYNGGLFRSGRYPFLETHKVADAFLAPALDELSRQEDEDGVRRFVDYKYLNVRELGALYEGLLEHRLKMENDEVHLENDKGERRLTGSYYTPDYVVKYIVEKTLAPVVEERKEALLPVLEEYRKWWRLHDKRPGVDTVRELQRLREKALETLLDVKVVDPAMGSGHFLVAAVDYLSERFSSLIAELDAEPITDALAEIRTEIKSEMGRYGLELRDEQLSDINLLKRMVMKRSVFGVDLNEMAVELAKLSLWLDAFTVGAPLSFLDHHLRHGNSVLGVRKDDFLDWVNRENPMWAEEIEREVKEATMKAESLLDVSDLTLAEVALSQKLYAEAEAAFMPLRHALDVYAASLFAPKPKRGKPSHPFKEAQVYLPGFKLSELADPPEKHHIRDAVNFARERHFFHWEFEFPEVFFPPEGSSRYYNPGFDAVIGNPPYVRQEQLSENKEFLKKVYKDVYVGKADLYTYFFARGLLVLREGGRLGFISSRQFVRAEYGKGLRKLLASRRIEEFVDFGENPVFEDASTFPGIFILQNVKPSYPVRFAKIHKGDFEEIIKAPYETQVEVLKKIVDRNLELLDEDAFSPEGWTLASAAENAVLRKMKEAGVPLGEYVKDILYGIKTGYNAAFFIDETTRNHLINEDPKSAELIKPLLVGDDVRRYYARWPRRYVILILSSTDFEGKRGEELAEAIGIQPHPWRSASSEEEARRIFEQTYPAIYKHLVRFEDRLRKRQDQGRWWWELRPCSYYPLFEQPKIVYPVIAKSPRFFLEEVGKMYANDKLFIIPGEDWYLLSVLNSKAAFNALRLKLSALGDADEGGRLELRAVHIQHLPIPAVAASIDDDEWGHLKDLYLSARQADVLYKVQEEIIKSHEGRVAGFLGYLAKEMQRMHKKRLEIGETWASWVEQEFSGSKKLGKEWLRGGWVKGGLEIGVEAVLEHFYAKRVHLSPGARRELEKYTREVLEELRPLYHRLRATDQLIDQIVYRLYGLTEDEIAIVEGRREH